MAKKAEKLNLLADLTVLRKISSHPKRLLDDDSKDDGIIESNENQWHKSLIDGEQLSSIKMSAKLEFLFSILSECEASGDVLLLFSQSICTLDMIEKFLLLEYRWKKDVEYFRFDGRTSPKRRDEICEIFGSSEVEMRAKYVFFSIMCVYFLNHSFISINYRLLLITTKAGGMGINLVRANRVIVFDASWNPSDDVSDIVSEILLYNILK